MLRRYKMITLTPSKSELAGKTKSVNKPTESIETAGSLAMLFDNGLMTMGMYDTFVSSNPFAVNYANYADCGDSNEYSGGFLSDFSNAVSVIGSDCGGYSAGCGGASDGGFSGGFTSMC